MNKTKAFRKAGEYVGLAIETLGRGNVGAEEAVILSGVQHRLADCVELTRRERAREREREAVEAMDERRRALRAHGPNPNRVPIAGEVRPERSRRFLEQNHIVEQGIREKAAEERRKADEAEKTKADGTLPSEKC